MLIITVVISCKKESEKTTDLAPSTDSISASTVVEVKPISKDLKVLTPEETTKFLQTKNDTLYVTNFFATWCGPCVKEIPHFNQKAQELKGKPVKMTFVNLDAKEVWNSEVPAFVDKYDIRNHTILLDGNLIDENFFKNNFKTWTGDAIPFTYMRRGDKTDEFLGIMTAELLNEKIEYFNIK